MDRTITTERRYPIKDYAYLHLADTLNEIPDQLALNPEFTEGVRFLQLINMEHAYRRYLEIAKKAPHSMALDEAIKVLEEMRLQTLKQLNLLLNGEQE